jgi:D-alanine transaminase
MSRIAYVNGAYVPHAKARISIEDRGFQFADSVYEVWAVRGGRLLDADGHFERLQRSLGELRIRQPMARASLEFVLRELLRRNRVTEGIAYLQVSRGDAPREHAFPPETVPPGVVATARRIDRRALEARAATGIRVLTTPDIRWGRCDIKTTGLLANVLAKQAARESGAFEAWFVDADGLVTEGASTNAWIVTRDGALVTRDLAANILRGVTRARLIEIAQGLQLRVEQRAFSVAEAKAASEAFISSASGAAVPVIAIDDAPIGGGKPGAIAARLREVYYSPA